MMKNAASGRIFLPIQIDGRSRRRSDRFGLILMKSTACRRALWKMKKKQLVLEALYEWGERAGEACAF
mgnify:CR=1 FL=1